MNKIYCADCYLDFESNNEYVVRCPECKEFILIAEHPLNILDMMKFQLEMEKESRKTELIR